MAAFGNDVERWNLEDAGSLKELLQPLDSVHYSSRLSPVKSISTIDHLLNLSGKADSAYSSFSGGSNIQEYHTLSLCNENYDLPSERLSYMDSEYVRAIYNPNAINVDFRDSSQPKLMDARSQNNSDGIGFCGQYGNTLAHDFIHNSLSPLSPSQSLLPPSPPARLDSYKIIRSFDSTRGGSSSRDPRSQNVLWSPHNNSQGVISTSEPKPHWNSRQKNERLPDEPKESDLSQNTEKKSNQHLFTRSSSSTLQECFESDSIAKTQKLHCVLDAVRDYKIPEEMNSKSFHLPPTSYDVNDIHEKKYFCATNEYIKPFRGADLQGHLPESREPEVPFLISHHRFWFDKYVTRDEDVTQDIKFSNSSFQNELVSDTNSCPSRRKASNDLLSCSSDERRKDMEELSQTHQSKVESSSQSTSLEGLKTGVTDDGELDFRSKTHQIVYCGPKSNLTSQFPSVFRYEMQSNDSNRDLNVNHKGEVPENLAHCEAPQLEFQKPRSTPVCDLASDKINKETTPMLYHLAGGRHTNMAPILNCKNNTKPTKDPGNIPKKIQNGNHLLIEQSTEVQKSNPPPKSNALQQLLDENIVNHSDDDRTLGSFGSSLDDTFMKDYREKIKVAQKKVLRETSFKRKDLQMSLPIRLKPNPSKRPSIEHFRSFSANEDVRFIPPDSLWETSSKPEDSKKPQFSRIGGRKRVTREQKKLCYSEPEKLDQLGMQQTPSCLHNPENTRVSSEENNGSGLLASRRKPCENKQRAWSTSTLSKTELKQIQHNAVVQYIERKISLKPTHTQQIPLAKPMQRPSAVVRHSEWLSNPNGSKTPTNIEASSQLQSSGRGPESFDTHVAWTERSSSGPSLGMSVQSRSQPLVREVDQSKHGPCSYAENHRSKDWAINKSQERSVSTPATQGSSRSPACTALAHDGQDQPAFTSGTSNEAGIADGASGVLAENSRAQPATGKEKSLEETGISETMRLPVPSQSTDQLHHMKGPGLPPGLENGSGSLPKHMTKEQVMELPARTQMTIPFPAYERPHIKSCAEDAPPLLSSELPQTYQPCSVQPPSPLEGDDVSVKDTLTNRGEAANYTAKPPSKSEEAAYISLLPVPEAGQKTSLHDPVTPEGCLGDEAKVTQEFWGGQSSKSSPGMQPTFETTLPSSREEVSRDNELEKERTDPLVSNNVIKPPQELVGVNNVTFSLDRPMTSLAQSDQDKNKTNCGALEVKSENNDNPGVSEKATDLSQVKLRSSEDQRIEELVHEIMAKDKSLVDILEFHLIRKTALDLMAGLFPVDLPAMDRSNRMRGTRLAQEYDKAGPLEFSPKSVLLPEKYLTRDTSQERLQESDDIILKKMELMSNIQSKLQHLWGERELLLCDIRENAGHGEELEAVVKAVCKPNEYERYLMYIGDLEKVVILLLSLSMRLARVQNAMSKMSDATDPEERQSLADRHSLLTRQREDAKDLKENLDRRERLVSGILQTYLSEQQLQDYRQFVKQKTSFLIEHKDLEELIKFHEEQLASLQKSVPL